VQDRTLDSDPHRGSTAEIGPEFSIAFSTETGMANEQSSELVQELRKIRVILKRILLFLALILLLLALHYALEGYLRWSESHYAVPANR
jgi:hypothetical protein